MNKTTPLATIALVLVTSMQSIAAITTIIELHMGESGSTGANNIALDSSGNGYHMTDKTGSGNLVIDTTTPAAPGSTAYTTFDGSAAMSTSLWQDSAATANLPTDNFALEMWIRHDNNSGWQRYLRSGSSGTIAFTNRDANNKGNLQLNGNASASIDSPAALSVGQWHHLAMIRTAGVTRYYIDGLAATGSFTANPVWNNQYAIGQKSHSENIQRFIGDVDELRMFTFEAGDNPVTALSINAVPEPSSLALMALGALSLTLRRRR